jgi:cold shock CspA family protein
VTGTIKRLDVPAASGIITAEDGLTVGFPLSAVMAYDLPVLAVGQVVSFELEDGRCSRARNVCVQKPPQPVHVRSSHQEATRPRYVGFEHKGNVRAYLFEWLMPGTEKRTFAVDADLALFTKHHVGMQEGPALCLHLLLEELDAEGTGEAKPIKCSLSDREMLAYVASRPVAKSKLGPKRAVPSSDAASPVV